MTRRIAELLRRYRHLNWALTDQGMVSAVNFLTGILLARYLGLHEFGRFSLAWMAVLFVNSLQAGLIISPMMSIGPQQAKDDVPVYYGIVVAQQVAFAALAAVLLFAGVRASALLLPEWSVEHLALPLAATALAFQLQEFLRRYFFSRGRGGAAFLNDAISYLGQLAVLLWLFQVITLDTAGALWVIAATSALAVAVGTLSVGRLAWRRAALSAVTGRQWRSAKWLTASALMQWASGNLFIMTAGALLGVNAVGGLKAAQNLMGVTHVLFQGLENVVPVRAASHYRQDGSAGLTAYLRDVAWVNALATALVAFVAAAAPAFWLALVFGDAYAAYGDLVRWFAVIYLLVSLLLPLRAGLRAVEHTHPIFTAYLATTIFSLAAAYPLVRWLELTGVMAGILLLQGLMLVVLWRAARKSFARRA